MTVAMQYRGLRAYTNTPTWTYSGQVSWDGVGARVKELRKAQGLEQEDLAALSRVSQATISRMEQGRSDPKIGDVYRVAGALGIKLSDLVAEDDDGPDLEVLLGADPEIRGAVIRLARNIPGKPASDRRLIARAIETFAADDSPPDARKRRD